MSIKDQIGLEDISEEYKQFIDNFKQKKTTDDCYTPENVYAAVLAWVVKEYHIDADNVVRPFWPGADYLRTHYPEGCTVVDNPPFSILSQICRTFMQHKIKFFLFAPYLTNLGTHIQDMCHIVCDVDVMYENGATVNTSFVTNLDQEYELRTAPELAAMIAAADKENRKNMVRTLPKYEYPLHVITASMLGYYGKHGIDFRIRREDCYFIRSLNSQRKIGKSIYGAGYLLSEKAAAEKAAAEKAAAEKAAAEKWQRQRNGS